jgi:hypothetical protein
VDDFTLIINIKKNKMKKIALLIFAIIIAINTLSSKPPKYKRINEIDKWNRGLFGYDDVWTKLAYIDGKYTYYDLHCWHPGLIACRLQGHLTPPNTNDPTINQLLEKYDDLINDIQNKMIEIAEEEAGNGNLTGTHTKKISNEDLVRLNLLFVFYTKWDYVNEYDGKQTVEFSIIEL